MVLDDLLDDANLVLPCSRLPDDGAKAWAVVEECGYEGMVAKDPQSRYYAGTTRSWMKVKVRHEGVFLVGGIRNVDAFDGVLVGELVGDEFQYRGIVEWGFRAPDVLELLREARTRRRTSPFVDLRTMHGAVWLEPRLMGEVTYAEIAEGRLWAPSWRGLITR